MQELLQEVLTAMKSNRMRIALTGFSIAWGMFILVVLLGSSGGFQRGLYKTFHLDINQIVRITTGKTVMPWEGMDKGRQLMLNINDAKAIERSNIQHIQRVCPMIKRQLEVSAGKNHVTIPVTGCNENYLSVDYRMLKAGRDFNAEDLTQRTKTCIIHERLARQLFQDSNPIGQSMTMGNLLFTVVGVCKSTFDSDIELAAYMPLSTMISVFQPDGNINGINLIVENLESVEHNEHLERELHDLLSSRLGCNPKDHKGFIVSNSYEQILSTKKMIASIGVFVWIIGIATLIAGIVGVSNIMLITIKERTRELGVRKAMGASNNHIITLVLLESVFITLIFGYIGMMLGVGLTQLLDNALGSAIPMFQNPIVHFWPIMGCNFIMILAGLVAGYVPAKRAVSIKLVEALTS
ncbi:MAG: ABC transporter permease [Prevotella sp.]|nr:ABC transporter permease [Prevotella sp.]